MLEFLRPDGNSDSDPPMEPIYEAIARGAPEDWAGETGQASIHRIDRDGSRWLFFSLAGPGRFFLYAQLIDGRKIYSIGDDPDPQEDIEIVIGGRGVMLKRRFLISADQAALVARYFVEQDGLLYPAVDWLSDGAAYWPQV